MKRNRLRARGKTDTDVGGGGGAGYENISLGIDRNGAGRVGPVAGEIGRVAQGWSGTEGADLAHKNVRSAGAARQGYGLKSICGGKISRSGSAADIYIAAAINRQPRRSARGGSGAGHGQQRIRRACQRIGSAAAEVGEIHDTGGGQGWI